MAVDVLERSLLRVAVTAAVCSAVTAGAEYSPVGVMAPALADQVTSCSGAPAKAAVNCWIWFLPRVTAGGFTVRVTSGIGPGQERKKTAARRGNSRHQNTAITPIQKGVEESVTTAVPPFA